MAGLQAEARATVLEGDAEFFRCDAGAEAPEDRIDQADGHTVTVNDGDVDGVFVHRFGQRFGGGHGAFGVDEGGEFRGRLFRQHVIQPRGRVGDKAVAGVIGEFRRLGLDMGAHGAEGVHGLKVELGEDVQHQDRRRALAVWRVLIQIGALVGAVNGGGVLAGDTGQIFHRVAAAQSLQRGDHVLGHFAFVKAFAALAGHAAQNFGLTGGAEDLADTGGLVVDEVVAAGRALQGGGVVSPVKSHAGGDGDAGVGIVDGRGDDAI